MTDTSKNGVWIDTKTDKVVDDQPEEGIQLVAPGGVITPATAKQIEALRNPPKTPSTVDLSMTTEATVAAEATVAGRRKR